MSVSSYNMILMWPVISALVWKQLRQRYQRNYAPFLISLFYPLFGMSLFTVIFTKITWVGSEGVPYPAFNLTGLVPWLFFAAGVNSAGGSLTSNSNLVTRLKFPRVALPVSAVLAELPSLGVNCLVLTLLLLHFGIAPGANFIWFAPLLIAQSALIIGVGMALSVLNAYSRSTMTLFQFILQAWIIASPVVYSLDSVAPKNRALYLLNPMAGIIDGWRKILLHHRAPDTDSLTAALFVSAAILAGGWLLFGTLQKSAADVAE